MLTTFMIYFLSKFQVYSTILNIVTVLYIRSQNLFIFSLEVLGYFPLNLVLRVSERLRDFWILCPALSPVTLEASSTAGLTECYCFLLFGFIFLAWINGGSGMTVALRIKRTRRMFLNWSVSIRKPFNLWVLPASLSHCRKQMKCSGFQLLWASHHNLACTYINT